jgi:Tetratricopeptide repeat
MNNLAVVLYDRGHHVEAEKLDRETLEIRRRVSGPEHSDTLMSMANLASALEKQGRYAVGASRHRWGNVQLGDTFECRATLR